MNTTDRTPTVQARFLGGPWCGHQEAVPAPRRQPPPECVSPLLAASAGRYVLLREKLPAWMVVRPVKAGWRHELYVWVPQAKEATP